MVEDEYVRLMYFYRSFFKDIFKESMDLIGRKGMIAILRTAANKYAKSKVKNTPASQKDFKTAILVLLELGRPEVHDGESEMITLKRCPFKTQISQEAQSIEEDIFCNICVGFINGLSESFKKKNLRISENRVRASKICKFEGIN